MLSINTNTDAMTALEYLNRTQGQLAATENAVSTGEKVDDLVPFDAQTYVNSLFD